MRRLGTSLWLIYAAGWVLFGLVEATGLHFSPPYLEWHVAGVVGAENTVVPGLLGLVVCQLTLRFSRLRHRWVSVLAHAGAACVYTVLWLALTLAPIAVHEGWNNAWNFAIFFRIWQLQLGLIVYAILASAFNAVRAFQQLREEERRANQAEILRTRAELEALRAKLQPHFLFNTLHTITALVRKDPGQAEDALLKLGDLLRYALQAKTDSIDDVALSEEWRFVEEYLEIEKIRLGDRLQVKLELGEGAAGCVVPVFSLQPLVENAIHHAIAPRARGGLLTMKARVTGDLLEIHLRDDGPGCTLEEASSGAGLGLSVVKRRFEMRFPQKTEFLIVTRPGAGFAITVRVPALEAAV